MRSKWVEVWNTLPRGTERLSAVAFEMPFNTDPSHQKSLGNVRTSLSKAVAYSFWGFCLRRRRWSLLFALDFSSKAQQASVGLSICFVTDLICNFRQMSLRFFMY